MGSSFSCGGIQGNSSGKTIGSNVTWDEGKKTTYTISERCQALPVGTIVGARARAATGGHGPKSEPSAPPPRARRPHRLQVSSKLRRPVTREYCTKGTLGAVLAKAGEEADKALAAKGAEIGAPLARARPLSVRCAVPR